MDDRDRQLRALEIEHGLEIVRQSSSTFHRVSSDPPTLVLRPQAWGHNECHSGLEGQSQSDYSTTSTAGEEIFLLQLHQLATFLNTSFQVSRFCTFILEIPAKYLARNR